LLLIVADVRGEFVPTIGGEKTDALNDQLGPCRAPDELPVRPQPVEVLPLAANEDEAEQVTTVRLEEERLKALNLPPLLQLPVVRERLVEDLECLLLPSGDALAPAHEERSFGHVSTSWSVWVLCSVW